MQHQHVLHYLKNVRENKPVQIDFVRPVISTILAAASSSDKVAECVQFHKKAKGYAEQIGLLSVMNGRYDQPTRGGLQGVTYTKLTRLSTDAEVEFCNQIIADFLYGQIGEFSSTAAHNLAKVVGELHDNVASHADGQGYSCAQAYDDGDAMRIEFSIADTGRGMLSNVRQVSTEIMDEGDAIRWCLRKGNTTAKPIDDWAQRLPEDAIISPFPESTPTASSDDHHVGEGLWQLCELIRVMNGKLWVWSGGDGRAGEGEVSATSEKFGHSPLGWQGVAIEFTLSMPKHQEAPQEKTEYLERLAKKLGL